MTAILGLKTRLLHIPTQISTLGHRALCTPTLDIAWSYFTSLFSFSYSATLLSLSILATPSKSHKLETSIGIWILVILPATIVFGLVSNVHPRRSSRRIRIRCEFRKH